MDATVCGWKEAEEVQSLTIVRAGRQGTYSVMRVINCSALRR
jgi:hypothetical protein